MQDAGLEFEVRVSGVDETLIKRGGGEARDLAMALARAKAAAVAEPGAIVIGCDQILLCNGQSFDKPRDLAQAREHLRRLRGHTHELLTAITCFRDGAERWHHLAVPRLTMRDFSDHFLDAYLARVGEAALHSVGAYRLEGQGAQLFAAIEGEQAAILGLPLLALLAFLRNAGVLVS